MLVSINKDIYTYTIGYIRELLFDLIKCKNIRPSSMRDA